MKTPTQIIIELAGHLYRSCLVGNPAPVIVELYAWMTARPQVGDLVLEVSSMHRNDLDHRLGYLERISDGGYYDQTFSIRCLDGSRMNWTNSIFVRVPIDRVLPADNPTPDAMAIMRIVEVAKKVGEHWRDQEGVNGALLDELGKLTSEGA